MRRLLLGPALSGLLLALPPAGALAQAPAPAMPAGPVPEPFVAGAPLRLMPNTRVFGSFRFAESCVFDAARDLIIAMNAGVAQNAVPNDGFVSLVNPDGTVHTLKWIAPLSSPTRTNGVVLNQPLGSVLGGGRLWTADGNVLRSFDLATGEPEDAIEVIGAVGFNDLAYAADGTLYATQTGNADGTTPWRIYRIAPDGAQSVFIEGAPLRQPNGIEVDHTGNVVVVNIGNNEVLTFAPTGELLATEMTVDAGNDGLVVLDDGTKYVSSVRMGTVSRVRPGAPPEVIAAGIPSAASMCYDPVRNQLVIPMNNGNALAFVALDE